MSRIFSRPHVSRHPSDKTRKPWPHEADAKATGQASSTTFLVITLRVVARNLTRQPATQQRTRRKLKLFSLSQMPKTVQKRR